MKSVPTFLESAVAHHRSGRLLEAESLYRKTLLDAPHHPDTLHLLGVCCYQRGQNDQAIDSFSRVITLEPSNPAYRNNLGVVLRAVGRIEEAAASYRKALELSPGYADAHANLGLVLHESGEARSALLSFEAALRLQPDHADALYYLANLLLAQRRAEESIPLYRRAHQAAPRRADVLNNLGNALNAAGRGDEAFEAYRWGTEVDPSHADAQVNLGDVLAARDRVAEAGDAYAAAARRRPQQSHWPIRIAALCPAVFPDREAIERYRVGLDAVLDAHRGGVVLPPDLAFTSGCNPSFHLSHHGHPHRPVKEKFAALFRHNFPPREVRLGDGPPRIGFLANSPHEGGFLRVIGGIVNRLTPGRFRPVLLASPRALPAMRAAIRHPEAEFVPFPDRLADLPDRVADARCDVLYHWQVGTDSVNYFLAHHRLAPVQCTSWGSHVTTGLPNVDYFLSSEWAEPPDADDHYTETLVRLPTFPTFEPRHPRPDPPARRAEFGLPEGRHLVMCLQRLAKFHPDFDPLLAEILRRDPWALLVLLEDAHDLPGRRLRARFEAVMPDVAGRVAFLPRQTHEGYLRLLSLADVVLDTPYYGAGHTGYDTLGLGLPLVTLPGPYKINRYALAYYRRMGFLDLVADDAELYVELAARLATDADFRREVSGRIASTCHALHGDLEVVREHEEFLERAIAEARVRASGPG